LKKAAQKLLLLGAVLVAPPRAQERNNPALIHCTAVSATYW
jgi:hypothetical protein